ncbi:hypothetical protein [uncultured Amnibacterium sp.]|uniref:hypothetical protein n=1 Tax=uncultured Amnibacterium sp. TaxID=1631851 RepID=UPI0035CA92BE
MSAGANLLVLLVFVLAVGAIGGIVIGVPILLLRSVARSARAQPPPGRPPTTRPWTSDDEIEARLHHDGESPIDGYDP